ncbi:hypothetical protein B0H10DRAFT_1809026, partial [Mycena sp. CBHHK59/15]
HDMDVSPEGVFPRLIREKRGFGSVCFAQNCLMLEMLRGLGYRVYPGAARVNRSDDSVPDFTSLQHQVLFVQPSPSGTETYVVDVGWGAAGLVRPILLSDSPSNVIPGACPPEEHRLTRRPHPSSSIEAPPTDWRLEMRCGTHQPDWRVVFAFSEAGFYPADFNVCMYLGAQRPAAGPLWGNPFIAEVLCVRHFLVDTEKGHIGRYVLARDRVKRQVGETSEVMRILKTEYERAAALREIFGVEIYDEDVKYIRGRVAALVS